MRRRIFAWFGITILLSGVVAGGVVGTLSGGPGAWRETVAHVTRFVGNRFAEVWDDPQARDHLARSVADELHLRVVLRDADGRALQIYGEACTAVPHEFEAPVQRQGQTLGTIEACATESPGGRGHAWMLGLVATLMVLWAASGVIAWRLTRPLAQLVRVTEAIGRGRLDTRVEVPRRRDELALVARAVNEMAARLQQQIEDQRELLAVVSHEIRTPLGHMRVLLDLARDQSTEGARDDPEDAGLHTLDEIERELLEVDRLVDQLLASSRLDFDQLDRRPLRADEVAARALARAELPSSHLSVETDALDVTADPTLLARALANLVDNAQAHGGGLRRLRVLRRDGSLCFVAEDEGPGLPREARSRLFESFVRGGDGGKLGLGLALVQRIAAAHGGEAFAEDRPEGGARVGLWIADDAPESSDASGEASAGDEAYDGAPPSAP